MPKGIGYGKPSRKMKTITPGSRSVSNTGQMSTSTQTTGATGSVANTTNISQSGRAGTSGTSGSVSVSSGGSAPTSLGANITYDGRNFAINPDIGTTIQTAASNDQVRSAITSVEGELARARQTALGMVGREHHESVNAAFDTAYTTVSETKKRLGY